MEGWCLEYQNILIFSICTLWINHWVGWQTLGEMWDSHVSFFLFSTLNLITPPNQDYLSSRIANSTCWNSGRHPLFFFHSPSPTLNLCFTQYHSTWLNVLRPHISIRQTTKNLWDWDYRTLLIWVGCVSETGRGPTGDKDSFCITWTFSGRRLLTLFTDHPQISLTDWAFVCLELPPQTLQAVDQICVSISQAWMSPYPKLNFPVYQGHYSLLVGNLWVVLARVGNP